MSRNSGLFWALLQCSFLWGNIFVFTYFKTDEDGTIKDSIIKVTYTVLSVLGLIGVGSFFLLGRPQSGGVDIDDSRDDEGIFSFVSRSLSKLTLGFTNNL